MGNQQSGGTQFCSSGELYTHRPEMTSFKFDPETRVGYSFSNQPKFQVQGHQKSPQQMVLKQQQIQEEIKEIPLSGPGKLKMANFFEKENQAMEPESRKPTSKVHISRLKEEQFNGVFGNVTIDMKGLVHYTDITGKQHCEDFDKETIEKIFPMGISFGGLTKSIWFKDGVSRDEAFEMMVSMPPSYKAVSGNRAKFALLENEADELADDDNIKIFEGLNKTNVIVHSGNVVLYTDLNKNKHCVGYNKRYIKKCFPKGICFGGLPKVIWFKDPLERDLCFTLMQRNMDEDTDEYRQNTPTQKYTGLYGRVVLHSDSQIEYTSLTGDSVKCFYEPSDILETFPMGISFGRLPKTIWFRHVEEREKCIEAMRSK